MKQTINLASLNRALFYITFATAFIGSLFSIDFGFFSLFPYRIFFLSLLVMFILGILVQGKIALLNVAYVRFYLIFFLFWIFYAYISFFWIFSFEKYIKDLILLFIGILTIFFTVYYARKIGHLKILYWIWLLAAMMLIVVGFWEIYTGQHLSTSKLSAEVAPRFLYYPTGTFHNQNDYATFLSLSTPFALSLLRYGSAFKLKSLGLVIFVFSLTLIVISSSRANILATTITIGFALILFFLKSRRKSFFLITVVIFILIAGFIPKIHELANLAIEQVSSIKQQAVNEKFDGFNVRLNLARNCLTFCADTNFRGVGVGNVEYWMDNFQKYPTGGHVNPHNWWFELLAEFGVFIFLGYLLMYLSLLMGLWRSRKRLMNEQLMICDALILSMIAFSIGAISPSSVYAFLPHWLLLSMSLASLNVFRKSKAGIWRPKK
jgi:teichuronic acid biosynthesis protein TuaE